MDLVGGYGSSDDDDEPQQQHQHSPQHFQVEKPKNLGKAPLSTSTGTAPAQASTKQLQQPAKAASSKSKKRKGSKKGSTKKKKKSKTVNALVLSPEIQAALARGDTLGDSDSDDQDAHKKPPKFVGRPAGSDPNDLLSLLPQPSTATNADDILLKNKKRRQDASRAKSQATSPAPAAAAANGGSSSVGGGVWTDQRTATPAAKETRKGKDGGSRKDQAVPSQASDSDDDAGDDLLAGMHAKSAAAAAAAAAAGPDASAASGPLFTLPSRARPPPGSAAIGLPMLDEGIETADTVLPNGDNAAQQPFEEGQGESVPQQWSAAGYGHVAGFAPQAWQGGTGYGGAVGGAAVGTEAGATASQHAAFGAASVQHQQAPYYQHPAAAQVNASFGAATQQQGGGGYEAEFGGGGGKATRRKGRDMERALARGDLGALGTETPVMDLHQGSNDYNPLRTKPVTAAMKQDQKHIEGSVYDPSTGQTVKTLEPTSTQKRKHQINQLAVQAASMERDLMERSGASRLTKAQTHAKYGW